MYVEQPSLDVEVSINGARAALGMFYPRRAISMLD